MQHTFNTAFNEAFNTLNDRQRQAVEHIFGPVMVVAGPGTGKTQILSARIGHILKETDYQAQNILALTFTEAGAYNMRQRLISFIGPEAYKVHIYTFHGFCNKVIQENRSFFGGYEDLQPLDELEELDVMISLIDEIPNDAPIKRLKGDIYYEKNRLKYLFRLMKQENWSVPFMHNAIDQYIQEIPNTDGFFYKRKYKDKQAGDLNKKGEQEIERMQKLHFAVDLLEVYQRKLHEIKRYDYQDMILWVIKAFQDNPNLLQSYREQYQFIMVDEYQDTNGAQNEVLHLLTGDPEDKPNVFVVGDDDQSIFRFQGANILNIMDFNLRYANEGIELVVLNKNYRSPQRVLNASDALIQNNNERLIRKIPSLEKTLEAAGKTAEIDAPVYVYAYPNERAEEVGIYGMIQKRIESGVAPDQIAVIYRKHRDIEGIRKQFDINGQPYNIRRRENILTLPLIKHVHALLTYIESETTKPLDADHLLMEILHFPYFSIPTLDIARLAAWKRLQSKDEPISWRALIADPDKITEVGVKSVERFTAMSTFLEQAIESRHTVTAQQLLEFLIDKGGILRYILERPDAQESMRILTTFYDFIKDRTAKYSNTNLPRLLEDIQRMMDHDIEMPVHIPTIHSTGVHFVTAHSAKGLEFDYVYIINASEKNWSTSNRGTGSYTLPPTLTDNMGAQDEEDERRLFYVAMTRAVKGLYISYPKMTMSDKAIEQSKFVEEILGSGDVEKVEAMVTVSGVQNFLGNLLSINKLKTAIGGENAWLDEVLQHFVLSPTALNKYLSCPVEFFYENVLRVPRARNASMGFGSAVHHALEQFFLKKQGRESFPSLDELIQFFHDGMARYHSHFTDKEMADLTAHGLQFLPEYYNAKIAQWNLIPRSRVEYGVQNVEIEGVPVSGKFDRVDVYGDSVVVLDYKTGNVKYARYKLKGPEEKDRDEVEEKLSREVDPDERHKLKLKLNGQDYWRQMVFYKLLVDADTKHHWHMQTAAISFVEGVERYEHDPEKVVVRPQDEQVVRQQIAETYAAIQRKEFSEGCGRPDCQWCSLTTEIGVKTS